MKKNKDFWEAEFDKEFYEGLYSCAESDGEFYDIYEQVKKFVKTITNLSYKKGLIDGEVFGRRRSQKFLEGALKNI